MQGRKLWLQSGDGRRVPVSALPFTLCEAGQPRFALRACPAGEAALEVEQLAPGVRVCGRGAAPDRLRLFDCVALSEPVSGPADLWTLVELTVGRLGDCGRLEGCPPERIGADTRLVPNSWNFEERELLKRSLLSFGYGRWEAIAAWFRDNRVHGINEKSESDLRAYANSLLKSIADNLSFQYIPLKIFLLETLQQPRESAPHTAQLRGDPIVFVNSRDWDLNAIRQRAKPWARRLQLMHRLNAFVAAFQARFEAATGARPATVFDHSAMLDGLPEEALLGQRPAAWWSRLHDTHLLLATHLHGYTHYNYAFVCDAALPLCAADPRWGAAIAVPGKRPDPLLDLAQLDFPGADAVTRRLKKLVALIARGVSEDEEQRVESSGDEERPRRTREAIGVDAELEAIMPADRAAIVERLRLVGPAISAEDGKVCFDDLRAALQLSSYIDARLLDKFVQVALFAAFLHISDSSGRDYCFEPAIHNARLHAYAALFTRQSAHEFLLGYVLTRLIRKFGGPAALQPRVGELREKLLAASRAQPADSRWEELLRLCGEAPTVIGQVFEGGFGEAERLAALLGSSPGAVANFVYLVAEQALAAAEESHPQPPKKRKGELHLFPPAPPADVGRPAGKRLKSELLQPGGLPALSFPLDVSHSLRLLALGRVSAAPGYHTEHNIYPVGFRSARQYPSMVRRGARAEYTCEILDGGERPLYRVVSSDDPGHPIVRDSSTGCWIQVCKAVNELSEQRKPKVTISGTERFGLLDPLVSALIEQMPGAELCAKYIRKTAKP